MITPTGVRTGVGLCVTVFALLLSSAAVADDDEPEFPHGDFDGDCSLCHGDENWTPAEFSEEFDHATFGFSRRGSHAQADCRTCHPTLEFLKADPACVSCHADVHRGELGIDCELCHTPRSFLDRSQMYRRHVETRFPLTGSHRSVDCEDCHTPNSAGNLQFVNTPQDCSACHLDEYLATTDPNHALQEFPQTCEDCHAPRAWEPARFSHNNLPAGAECVDCHLDDYNATANPNHGLVGFPQDCEFCHAPPAWVPPRFDGLNHDGQYFPIFSGQHRNRWDSCTDCHTVANDFTQFSCLECHAHDNENELRNRHEDEGVTGFQYVSSACLECHPDGRE